VKPRIIGNQIIECELTNRTRKQVIKLESEMQNEIIAVYYI
jgi:hypothetical protein